MNKEEMTIETLKEKIEQQENIIKQQQEKEETIRQQKELLDKYNKPKKTYVLWIRQYDITVNDYVVREKIVNTHDIYHEIGYIYCNEISAIKRIDFQELEQKYNLGGKE